MIYLTEEQAQQIEAALMKIADLHNLGKIQPEVIAFETLYIIRAARAQEQAEQEPVATHICNLWVDPITKEYVVDHCDHPIDELIPAYAAPVQQAEQEPPVDSLMVDVSALLGPFVEDGKPIRVKDARDILRRVRKRRFTAEPAPVRTKDLTDIEDLQDAVTKALKKAFQLGQTYWQQADSESYAANKRADVTQELYWKLEGDTRAVIAADREKNRA